MRPKVLLLDIETAPVLGYVWSLWNQNVAINQIHTDWHVLSWAAKWLDSAEVLYQDQRRAKSVEDDAKILKAMWKLLDTADVVITHNGKKFDVKKLNARFAIHGFGPPSPFKHIDTLQLARKHFGFSSNRLEYLSDILCTKYKKLSHAKFSGFSLWTACLAGNFEAWDEMAAYNKQDVLALEELYQKLAPWDQTVNFNLYHTGNKHVCNCGSTSFKRKGFMFTVAGKYQRYRCKACGAWSHDKTNLLTPEKRKNLRSVRP